MVEQSAHDVNVELEYTNLLKIGKEALLKREFNTVKEILAKAIAENFLEPAAYNLLGVVFEYEGEALLAKKMYRAALAVEPSYIPALENLNRTCQWVYSKEGMNWG